MKFWQLFKKREKPAPLISKKQAIKLARDECKRQHRHNYWPHRATLEEQYWKVNFSSLRSSTPIALVNKDTGAVKIIVCILKRRD